jgi:hypothetical protein
MRSLFRDYRLRVAAVLRDYDMSKRREQAPADSRAIHDVSLKRSGEQLKGLERRFVNLRKNRVPDCLRKASCRALLRDAASAFHTLVVSRSALASCE